MAAKKAEMKILTSFNSTSVVNVTQGNNWSLQDGRQGDRVSPRSEIKLKKKIVHH